MALSSVLFPSISVFAASMACRSASRTDSSLTFPLLLFSRSWAVATASLSELKSLAVLLTFTAETALRIAAALLLISSDFVCMDLVSFFRSVSERLAAQLCASPNCPALSTCCFSCCMVVVSVTCDAVIVWTLSASLNASSSVFLALPYCSAALEQAATASSCFPDCPPFHSMKPPIPATSTIASTTMAMMVFFLCTPARLPLAERREPEPESSGSLVFFDSSASPLTGGNVTVCSPPEACARSDCRSTATGVAGM